MYTINFNTMVSKGSVLFLLIILFCSFSQYSSAAFCSLRDPVETINKLYPDSTSYKSIVKIIDEDIRNSVQKLLPPNTLHFSELGKHTLYVAFKKEQPIGYVHVRSEESNWGLVEIAWAMTLDLEIIDFMFQRCRSRQKSTIEDESFRTQLRGRTFTDITKMLNADGLTLNTSNIDVPPKAKELAEIVLRCGMKTLLVTQLGWSDEIKQYRLNSNAQLHFDNASEVVIIDKPVAQSVAAMLDNTFNGADTGIDRSAVTVAKVLDVKKKAIGMIYETQLNMDDKTGTVTWFMTPEGKVVHVNNSLGWGNSSTRKAFEKTIGRNYKKTDQCNDRADLLTLEAVLTAKAVANK